MKAVVLAVALATAALASPVAADDIAEVHTFHCWLGCPVGAPATNDLIVREIYTLSSNDETKLADWVAYRVTPDTIGPSKTRNWHADPWLSPDETLEEEDYDDSNRVLHTDRGHQAPLAAFSGTPFWNDTNSLSNITPQSSDLNEGAWQRLEAKETTFVKSQGTALYVLTGPLFEAARSPLPKADEPHRVPSGYWKVLITSKGEIATFIFQQNTPRNADVCAAQVQLAEIEARSGLRFFPRQPVRQFTPLAPRLGCHAG